MKTKTKKANNHNNKNEKNGNENAKKKSRRCSVEGEEERNASSNREEANRDMMKITSLHNHDPWDERMTVQVNQHSRQHCHIGIFVDSVRLTGVFPSSLAVCHCCCCHRRCCCYSVVCFSLPFSVCLLSRFVIVIMSLLSESSCWSLLFSLPPWLLLLLLPLSLPKPPLPAIAVRHFYCVSKLNSSLCGMCVYLLSRDISHGCCSLGANTTQHNSSQTK